MLRTTRLTRSQQLQEVNTLKALHYEWGGLRYQFALPGRDKLKADRIEQGLLILAQEYADVALGVPPRPDSDFIPLLDDSCTLHRNLVMAYPPSKEKMDSPVARYGCAIQYIAFLILERLAKPGEEGHFAMTVGGYFWKVFRYPMLPINTDNLDLMMLESIPISLKEQVNKKEFRTIDCYNNISHSIRIAEKLLEQKVVEPDALRPAVMSCIKDMIPLTTKTF